MSHTLDQSGYLEPHSVESQHRSRKWYPSPPHPQVAHHLLQFYLERLCGADKTATALLPVLVRRKLALRLAVTPRTSSLRIKSKNRRPTLFAHAANMWKVVTRTTGGNVQARPRAYFWQHRGKPNRSVLVVSNKTKSRKYTYAKVAEIEAENGMSRTSSMSANRSNLGKRGKVAKQRRDSDGFDSRHQYQPYWGPQQQTWVPQPPSQFAPTGPQYGAAGPSNFQVPPNFVQQGPTYAAMPAMAPAAPHPAYQAAQVRWSAPKPYYSTNIVQFPGGGSPVVYAPQPQVTLNTPSHGWQPTFNTPGPYPQHGPPPAHPQAHLQAHPQAHPQPPPQVAPQVLPQGPQGPPQGPPQVPLQAANQSPGQLYGPGGFPYAFGQLPANANPHDPKSQHPIPGSYNRNHAFNPKTQSFSPGVAMAPVHAPQPPFTAPGSHHSSPQIGTPPHLAYTGYQPQMPPPYGGAYGMARQGSNNSIPSYHGPPQGTPHVSMQQPPMPVNGRPHGPSPNGQMYSHLPTYGNPATLPQKPASGL